MDTTKSFRINQPARSMLKAQGRLGYPSSASQLLFRISGGSECISCSRDGEFLLIALEIFRLEEMLQQSQEQYTS